MTARDPLERFWCKVRRPSNPNECFVWTAGLTRDGYGHFADGGMWLAHRWVYERMVGAIPEDLTIDHLCRNRACVNPLHLEAVTRRENIMRGYGRGARLARLTHCRNGHAFAGDNLIIDRAGKRRCRQCRRQYEYTYSRTVRRGSP